MDTAASRATIEYRPGARRAVVAVVIVGALVLAGCGGSGQARSTGDGGPTTGPASEAPTTSSEASATTEAVATTTEAPTTMTVPPTTTVPPATTTTAPLIEQVVEPAGPLQSGSKGKRTLALQQALHDQRYDAGEPDGKLGLKTTQAIWAFQALHGLAADGVVNPLLETAVLARTPQPMLRPQLGPTHTEVDLTRQVLIVFRDGQPTLVTHVSSGSGNAYCEDTDHGKNCGDAVTPVGVFRFIRRIKGVRHADLGKLYDPVYFKGGYAVHGAPSVPNHPASHGCVRIPMTISDYFQTLVNDGDPIEVFR